MNDGIGHKIGSFIQAVTMFFAGFAMGFAYGWKLTLVILAITPLLAISGAILGKVSVTKSTGRIIIDDHSDIGDDKSYKIY